MAENEVQWHIALQQLLIVDHSIKYEIVENS